MKNFILSIQHLLAMYAGAILVPIIVGTSLKFTPEEIAYLVTVDIFYVWCSDILTSEQSNRYRITNCIRVYIYSSGTHDLIGQTKGLGVLYGSLFLSGI